MLPTYIFDILIGSKGTILITSRFFMYFFDKLIFQHVIFIYRMTPL